MTAIAPPTGTVALVFTDVQGSTALWEHAPSLMREALALHDATLRAAIERFGGYEVKTEGDAFMVAFARAADAIGWCLAVQLDLVAAAWPEQLLDRPEALEARTDDGVLHRGLRVRMGAHVGDPDCRPDPNTGRMDYYGPMVNRAARISAAGHGGQVLVSRAALSAAGDPPAIPGPGAPFDLLDLGEHRLKGLIAPEHLFQLLPRALGGRGFPPVRTLAAPRTNLTAASSEMLGRSDELDRIDRAFSSSARLVTLVGPGGAGKTRLAREHAFAHVDDLPGGAWFCDLSGARTTDDVQSTMAGVLGVALPAGAAPAAAGAVLGRALAARDRLLFVLDNLEQIVDAAAPAVAGWLSQAPAASFLATSRQPLGLAAEATIELGALSEDAAVTLLAERARRAGADVDEVRDRAALAVLATRLDRMPLALELAAPRLRILSPQQLDERLAQGLALVRKASPDVPARHASLRAAIAASWELLDGSERAALSQCRVFHTFTIEAAEAVLELDDAEPSPLDVVQALRDKSLLASERAPGNPLRFSLYASVRAFVDEVGDAEVIDAAADRHAHYYVALGERLVRESIGPRAVLALAELAREVENFQLVLHRRCPEHPGLTARAALCLDHVLAVRGPGSLRRGVLDLGVEAATANGKATLRVRTLISRARFRRLTGDLGGAFADLELADTLGPLDGHAELVAALWTERGQVARLEGKIERAREALARAIDDAPDDVTLATALDARAALDQDQSDLDAAEAHLGAALAAAVRVGDVRGESRLRQNLGAVLHDAGELDRADEAYRAALELARGLGDGRLEGIILANLGNLLGDRGQLDEAQPLLDAAHALIASAGDLRLTGNARLYSGLVALRHHRLTEGKAAIEQALAAHAAAGARRFVALDEGYLALIPLLATAPTTASLADARARFARAAATLAELGDAHMQAYFAMFAALAIARDAALAAPSVDAIAVKAAWPAELPPASPPWLIAARAALVRAPVLAAAGLTAPPAPPCESTHLALAQDAAVAAGATPA